jgi:hypothetical protein
MINIITINTVKQALVKVKNHQFLITVLIISLQI